VIWGSGLHPPTSFPLSCGSLSHLRWEPFLRERGTIRVRSNRRIQIVDSCVEQELLIRRGVKVPLPEGEGFRVRAGAEPFTLLTVSFREGGFFRSGGSDAGDIEQRVQDVFT